MYLEGRTLRHTAPGVGSARSIAAAFARALGEAAAYSQVSGRVSTLATGLAQNDPTSLR